MRFICVGGLNCCFLYIHFPASHSIFVITTNKAFTEDDIIIKATDMPSAPICDMQQEENFRQEAFVRIHPPESQETS